MDEARSAAWRAPDPRAALRVGLWVVVLYVLLAAVLLLGALLAPPEPLGLRAGQALTSVLAVLTWALAGVLGSRALRRAGEPRLRSGASAVVGGAVGYLALPGLVSVIGLVLSGAGPDVFLRATVISALLAGVVAGAGAALAPHAPPPAPYAG